MVIVPTTSLTPPSPLPNLPTASGLDPEENQDRAPLLAMGPDFSDSSPSLNAVLPALGALVAAVFPPLAPFVSAILGSGASRAA
jgi:hypothetical protein